MGTTMTNEGVLPDAALYRLLTWSSPGYPTGAFSYSHGLEWAVETGYVTDLPTLLDYITAVLTRGGGWIDAVLFAQAWRLATPGDDATPPAGRGEHIPAPTARASASGASAALDPAPTAHALDDTARAPSTAVDRAAPIPAQAPSPSSDTAAMARASADAPAPSPTADRAAALDELSQLASAFRGSAETALESRQQGAAFLDVTRKAWPHEALDAFAHRQAGAPVAHCIAVALACAAHNITLIPALHSYLHAVAANLVSAGARLIPLGQTQAQIAIAQLSATITETVERALTTSLDDMGTAAPLVEICSLRHETQYTRLFRS